MNGRQQCWGRLGLAAMALLVGGRSWGEPASWSQFRGEQSGGRSGVASFPTEWSEKNILWKVDLEALGDSSPSVANDRCYLLTCNRDGTTRSVTCRSMDDGSLAWEYPVSFDTHPKHQKNSYATATVACAEEGVYAAFGSPTRFILLSLDYAGRKRWEVELGPYVSQHGPGASPVLAGPHVVIPIEQDGPSRVVAVKRSSGEIAWSTERNGKLAAYATPLFLPDEEGGQLIVSSTAGLTSLAAETGTVLWDEKCFDARCVSSPILWEGGSERLVLASCGGGGKGTRLVAVRPERVIPTGEARKRWELNKTVPYCPTPLALGPSLYCAIDNGLARCVRVTDGGEVWTERAVDKITSSPIEVGGNVLFVSETGKICWIAPQSPFEKVGEYQLDDEFLATPAFASGRLLLRGQKYLWCIGEPK